NGMVYLPFPQTQNTMKNSHWLTILALAACSSPKIQEEAVAQFQTVGSIEGLDPALNSLIPSDAKIEILASGFEWAEGPLWLEDQNALIFTDVPTNKIWKWTEQDSLSLYLEPSGYLGDRTDKNEP